MFSRKTLIKSHPLHKLESADVAPPSANISFRKQLSTNYRLRLIKKNFVSFSTTKFENGDFARCAKGLVKFCSALECIEVIKSLKLAEHGLISERTGASTSSAVVVAHST